MSDKQNKDKKLETGDIEDKEEGLENGWMELASVMGGQNTFSLGGSQNNHIDLTEDSLKIYLRNPVAYNRQIRNASRYMTRKHGVLKEVLRIIRDLLSLEHTKHWSRYEGLDEDEFEELQEKVEDFLEDIDPKQFVRDGLFEVAEEGTIVTCLRSRKYVQFLDLDELRINKQRNGQWVVEYDLNVLRQSRDNLRDKQDKIASLPPEVTVAKYNDYLADKDQENSAHRFVELNNCHVVNIDAKRNSPYGMPYTIGAWGSLLHKNVFNQVEKSVAARIIKQIVVLQADYVNKEKNLAPKRETLENYFRNVDRILKGNGVNLGNDNDALTGDASKIATLALPHFLSLDSLKVDTTMFKEELYNKVDNDFFGDLGVSPVLISGTGGDYASANLNSEKVHSFVFAMVEKFEKVINSYLKQILGKKCRCKLKFSTATSVNRDKEINYNKEFYLQTGVAKPWIESLYGGGSFETMLDQAKHEKQVLKTEDYLYPAQNAYTSSGKDNNEVGRESIDQPTNDNTNKSKSKGGNTLPSPSDEVD